MTAVRTRAAVMFGGDIVDTEFSFPEGVRRWFAVRAQPRKEQLAELHLNRQNFETFLPRIARSARRPTGTVTTLTPFFPGYLFVRLDLAADRWRTVNGTIGVIGLVQFGEHPTPTPAGLIENMATRASQDSEVRLESAPLHSGQAVRFVGGAFDGRIGAFEATSPDERVTILLALMSREVRVRVPRSAVMAV